MHDQIDQAIYDLVHEGTSAAELASVTNMNAGTLGNKASFSMDNHHLTVKEAVLLQNTRQRYDVLHAECAALNHACIPLGDYSGASDMELLDAYARYHKEVGDMAVEICRTLEVRQVTKRHVADVRKEFFESAQAGLALIERLDGLAEEGL